MRNIRWGDERTYSFAFDGVEAGGTVAVGALGTVQNRADRLVFLKGLEKMIEVVRPDTVICYGGFKRLPDSIKRCVEIIEIPSRIEAVHRRKGGL